MKIILVISIGVIVGISSIALFVFTQNTKTSDFNSKLLELNFTDREYAQATEDLPIVKAFLEKYPNATVIVQSNSSFKLVDYHLEKIKAPTWIETVKLTIPVKVSDFTPDTNKIGLLCSTSAGSGGMTSYEIWNQSVTASQAIESLGCLK